MDSGAGQRRSAMRVPEGLFTETVYETTTGQVTGLLCQLRRKLLGSGANLEETESAIPRNNGEFL